MRNELNGEPIVKISDELYRVEVPPTPWTVQFTVPEEYPYEPPVAHVRRTGNVGQWLPVGPLHCTPAMTLMGYARSLITELDARGDDIRSRSDGVFEDAIVAMDPELSASLFDLSEQMEATADAFNDTS